MIGAHRSSTGELHMRRNETPLRRVNPGGDVVWVARATRADGKRRSHGTFAKRGACKRPAAGGMCCAQHRIWHAYEQEDATPQTVGTVREYAETRWLQHHPRSERSNSHLIGRLRKALALDLGDGPLGDMLFADVDRSHALELIDQLLRAGHARNGAKTIQSAVSAMWQDALDDEWTRAASPFTIRVRVDDPRIQREARTANLWSWEQMRRLCAAGEEHEPMLRVLADCGLRIGELFPLHREDVKLSAGACDEQDCLVHGPHLHVRRKAWRGREFAGAKGPHGERIRKRVVPVPDGLAVRLAPVVLATAPGGFVFTAPQGGMWHEPDWRRGVWWVAARVAGMREATPHDFRHSWVSLMRAAGVDPAHVAAAAGHTLETATRVYTHPVGDSCDVMRRVAS